MKWPETWRAVVKIGRYGSWSQGGYHSADEAKQAARKYIKDHPELSGRASPDVELDNG